MKTKIAALVIGICLLGAWWVKREIRRNGTYDDVRSLEERCERLEDQVRDLYSRKVERDWQGQ